MLMSEKITAVQRRLLEEVADLHGVPEGAYNIRANGHLASRQTTANISIALPFYSLVMTFSL